MAAAQHAQGQRQGDGAWIDGLFHVIGLALDCYSACDSIVQAA